MQVLWFRRDLRLADHPALVNAAAGPGPVLPLFVIDPQLWAGAGLHRRARLAASLLALDESLGGRLTLLEGAAEVVIPELAATLGAQSVHITADTAGYGRRRDQRVTQALRAHGSALRGTGTPYAIGPGTLVTGEGRGYRVFTPFSKAWRAHGWPSPPITGSPSWAEPWGASGQELRDRLRAATEAVDHHVIAGAGEAATLARWQAFCSEALGDYAEGRNRPDLLGTSMLSTALKFGEVHPRTLLRDLRRLGDDPSWLAQHPLGLESLHAFENELAWREFSADVLWQVPQAAWSPLVDRAGRIASDDPAAHPDRLEAWRRGLTGFPLVDAGQRQLLATGWMHNRVRMVTASFLVKDLHLPWQVGAAWFMRLLTDADVASNALNWQWVAGTGTDAAPYYRIFNPITQGEKFDPAGDYVRRWIPELAHLPGDSALRPWEHPDGLATGYPARIVDHSVERLEALARYGSAK